jgi:hypothetical protein
VHSPASLSDIIDPEIEIRLPHEAETYEDRDILIILKHKAYNSRDIFFAFEQLLAFRKVKNSWVARFELMDTFEGLPTPLVREHWILFVDFLTRSKRITMRCEQIKVNLLGLKLHGRQFKGLKILLSTLFLTEGKHWEVELLEEYLKHVCT